MAVDLSCFDGIVGLANCACPCLEQTAPDGYNDSASGLFVTDLVPISMLDGVQDCNDPSSPWNVVSDARRKGINQFAKDLKQGLMSRNQFSRESFKGMIGEKSAREALAISTTYAGIRISSPRIKGAYFQIDEIGGVFDGSALVTVQIYDRFNNTVGDPVQISTVAGGHASTACNISLPLWVDGAAWPEYFAVYTVNQSNLPRKSRFWCPTCKKRALPYFSLTSPYYLEKWNGDMSWANWVMLGAWTGDTITDFDLAAEETLCGGSDGYTNGLTIRGSITCDPVTAVCLGELDYTDPVAMSAAHALNYISAISAAETIIRNPEPYRNSAVSADILKVDILQWYKDYKINMDFVTYNANTLNSDCIFCKPKYSMSIESKLP